MGPGMCEYDIDCKGERVCSDFFYCVGYSGCEDDKSDDQDLKCMIDESLNPEGDGQCNHSMHCKGDRYCGEFGFCIGESNCPDDEMTPEQKC